MKITVSWQDDEEGLAVCREKGKEVCCIRIFLMGENVAELSLELPKNRTEINEKVIFEMTKCLLELRSALPEEGITEGSFVAEEGSLSEKLLNVLNSTGVVNEEYSEYLLKKQPGACNRSKSAAEKTLSILQVKNGADGDDSSEELLSENEDSEDVIYCTRADEKDLFSCKLLPYRDGFYIYEVLVREEMRNQGIGTAAMRELLARADELPGAEPPVIFYLQVSSLNERALHLYRKLGFETETKLCYYKFGGETENPQEGKQSCLEKNSCSHRMNVL